MHGRHQHLLFDAVQHLFGNQRGRAVGPHAAGVGAVVEVVGPLVVLGRRQRDDRATVGNRQDARLLPVEALFDHDLIAGVAELPIAADAFDRFDRLGSGGTNKNSFAGRQSVGLDDHRHILAVFEKRGGVIGIAKDLVVGGRHVGVPQQIFAEDFAPLEFRGNLARAENPEFGIAESIDQARNQRGFRTHDGELNLVLLGKLDQPRDVGGRNVDVFGFQCGTGIARRHENPIGAGALSELPSQRVFAAPFADNQYVHGYWNSVGSRRGDYFSERPAADEF